MELKEQIEVEIGRGWRGVSVRVKVAEEVEEFIKSMGSGIIHDVRTYGIYWKPQGGTTLDIYNISSNEKDPMMASDGSHFVLNKPGQPLLLLEDHPDIAPTEEVLNLSFLRLVGISKGNGVTFTVKDVCDKEQLADLRDRIQSAIESFYVKYLKPINLIVTILTQER